MKTALKNASANCLRKFKGLQLTFQVVISKRGDRYLRKLLIHGARAVVRTVDGKQDGRSRWLQGLIVRRGKNRAGVAQANKTARVAWVLLAKGERYRPAA